MSQSFLNDNHNHSFNVGIRKEVGCTDSALVHFHITYWIRHNQQQNINLINGRYWMYQSWEEMSRSFGYLSPDQIKRCINKLIDHGLIMKDDFNKWKPNRTKWYTLTDKSLFLLGLTYTQPSGDFAECINTTVSEQKIMQPIEKSHSAKSPDPLGEIAQAIEDTKTDTKKSIDRFFNPKQLEIKNLVHMKLGDNTLSPKQANELLELCGSIESIGIALNNFLEKSKLPRRGKPISNKIAYFIISVQNNMGYFPDKPVTKDKKPVIIRQTPSEINGALKMKDILAKLQKKNSI